MRHARAPSTSWCPATSRAVAMPSAELKRRSYREGNGRPGLAQRRSMFLSCSFMRVMRRAGPHVVMV